MKLKNTPKEYQEYWHSNKNPMSWSEWQRIENDKKMNADNFRSHNTPKTTLWDRMRKDRAYESAVESRNRIDEDGHVLGRTMSNRQFVPRKNKK